MLSLSLFQIANQLFRDFKYADSAYIYELLADIRPEFSHYDKNSALARARMVRIGGVVGERQYIDSATEYQKRLTAADIVSFLNDPMLIDECFFGGFVPPDAQHLLARANAKLASSESSWLITLNEYFGVYGLDALRLVDRSSVKSESLGLYFRLQHGGVKHASNGPLVTICMSCFNSEEFVEHAVRSLLAQSYHNFELLIFDDRSTDNTLSILRRLESEDERINVYENPENFGTYVSRNQCLSIAKGKYFTVLDADDFAHPQRLACQVAVLEQSQDAIAVVGDWVRVYRNGRFYLLPGWGGHYQHESVASLMFKTDQVKADIGYWDCVRFSADTEFLFRIKKRYGERAVASLKIPITLSLFHESSLTNDPVTGIGVSGLSDTRKQYRASWMDWHRNERHLYLPYPPEKGERPFAAPEKMIVRRDSFPTAGHDSERL